MAPSPTFGHSSKGGIAGGAELRIGTVTGLLTSRDGSTVGGAIVDGEAVAAEAVVIAMGPWSLLASQWLPLQAVFGLKGHSLIFRYAPDDAQVLFAEYESAAYRQEPIEIMG